MKFHVDTLKHGRLGKFCIDTFLSSITTDTPTSFLYTRHGQIPYITADMLSFICGVPNIATVELSYSYDQGNVLKVFGNGLSDFMNMHCISPFLYCPLLDYSETIRPGHNSVKGTAIWARGNKIVLSPELFADGVNVCRPHMCQVLCDADTGYNSTRKRIEKSVDRSTILLKRFLNAKSNFNLNGRLVCFSSVTGGFDFRYRLQSVQEVSEFDTDGFVIVGFHSGGANVTKMDFGTVSSVLCQTLGALPQDKPRALPGAWSPLATIDAVSLGIDFFDGTYPFVMTKLGCALTFPFTCNNKLAYSGMPEAVDRLSGDGEHCVLSKSGQTSSQICDGDVYQDAYSINLSLQKFSADLHPLVSDCKCYCCSSYSKAYIHHLLVTSELLGPTLLMMHNLQWYNNFLSAIRSAVCNEKLDELRSIVSSKVV